jgi:hypothetical protein
MGRRDYPATPGAAAAASRSGAGGGGLEPDAVEAGEADEVDEPGDLRLRLAQPEHPAAAAQPAGEHGQVDHERRIGEAEAAEFDHDVFAGSEGASDGTAPTPLRGPDLLPPAPQYSVLFVERDDGAARYTLPLDYRRQMSGL